MERQCLNGPVSSIGLTQSAGRVTSATLRKLATVSLNSMKKHLRSIGAAVLALTMMTTLTSSCGMPLPLPGHPVAGSNGVYRLPDFASCSVWGFTPDELAVMQSAIKEWEIATDGKVSVRLDGGPSFHCEIFPVKTCPILTGFTSRDESIITISMDTKCAGASLKQLMIHELGHAFGLNHQESGVMHATKWAPDACIDSVTLKAFCEIHHCSNNVAPTCG